MYFIVDNESPAAGMKQGKMHEVLLPAGAVGQNLVRAECDRPGCLGLAAVFGDVIFCQIGLVQQFVPPLPYRGQTAGQNQRALLQRRHRRHADQGLTGPAG